MKHQSGKPQVASCDNVEQDADALENKFGDLAKIYAENRSEAAQLRGADHAARHWRQVKDEIEDSDC